MSRISVETYYLDVPITVIMGWDRPTRQLFVYVDLTTSLRLQTDRRMLPLHNFNKEMAQEAPATHSALRHSLEALGVVVPEAAYREVQLAAMNNEVNGKVIFREGLRIEEDTDI